MAALNDLEAGTILSTSNGGVKILLETHHRALNGNYHRNADAISQSLTYFTDTPSQSGENAQSGETGGIAQRLKQGGVDYVMVCRQSAETKSLTDYAPNGFMAKLVDRDIPAGLRPAFEDLEAGNISVYKVSPP